ncbi:MAG: M20/M25/M40 family metallo-hydrolase [Chloroflexi bacterium]|nr:M20/M25/M40 family metallo-hydrolase [Chloroflexota bacterium]
MTDPTEVSLVAACRAVDPGPLADLTLELLRTWSPPGSETVMAERMAAALEAVGARVRLDAEFPGSPSVIAEMGTANGPTLQWHGHLDAIDVPHADPVREGDLLVGRGAADMKGPLAAMVGAADLLRRHDLPRHGRLLITFHGRHESGGNEPLHALIARGIHGDAVITGELGGGRELPVGGLGLTFWEVSVERPGMAIHETLADPGTLDPVEVGRLLHEALAGLRDRIAGRGGSSSGASLFVGRFTAGDYFNRSPNAATLQGTRRHDVDETLADVEAELRATIDEVALRSGTPITLEVTPIAEAFDVDPEAAIVRAMRGAHRDLFGNELRLVRGRVASNAVHFVQEAGIPAVAYGPDHATNHSDREVLPVAELARLAGGFALASARWFTEVARP